MSVSANSRVFALVLWCSFAVTPMQAMADDIDIFVKSPGAAPTANVLIILDNTSNWSANNQGWPPGPDGNAQTQGQAEMNALISTVRSLNDSFSVGLMLLTTVSGNPGGMMVFGINKMTDANKDSWIRWLEERRDHITDPAWKAPSSANYGAVMFDAFKYFGGYTSPVHATDGVAGTPVDRTHFGNIRYADIPTNQVDPSAYSNGFTRYASPPLTGCTNPYIIFIGNGFPNSDDTTLLPGVGGDATPVPVNLMDGGSKVYTADEWARFLHLTDVSAATGQQNVTTYTIDVYGASPGPTHPKQAQYLANMAKQGGGTAFSARSVNEIKDAIDKIMIQIQGVNGTFASASLPVNTTNRSQDKNQVFIPMFRPDKHAAPRWMGNLKRYQLISVGGNIELGDSQNNQAVNPLTGLPTECAVSYWTTGSETYWSNVPEDPPPVGRCPSPSTPYSDAPDGPIAEKGGVAEVIRRGNDPPSTDAVPTPWAVNRTVLTQSGSALTLTAFDTTSSGLASSVVDFVLGHDVNDENSNNNTTESRPSLHGDSIHSRPLPIDYGDATGGVTVYYGSNDGTLRAVDAATGRERWAFIAPEFFPRLSRLMTNSPLINYPDLPAGLTPTPTAKDYYFDGSLGVYQTVGNSPVWIYPSMRRGGRMIYALNVTNPNAPELKWKIGCPNLTNDTDCTTGMSAAADRSAIGQTWSTPNVAATVNGYTGPVVVVGGGYDRCEDANTATPDCSSPKGAGVYVIDADTGTVIKRFSTTRSVAADVALLAVTTVGKPDHAYAVDTGGNIYRIDFGPSVSEWTMNRVAYTNGSGRKFLFTPALALAGGGKVYVALGSGDREHPLISQYPYDPGVTNRFYVYLDDLSATTATNLDTATTMQNFSVDPTCSTTGVLPSSTSKGWFMDLNQNGPGEQTVTSALIAAGMVTFSTNRPKPATEGTCEATLGEARGYWLNLFNGSGAIGVSGTCNGYRSSIFTGGGLPPSPVLGTVAIGNKPTTVVIGAPQRQGGANSPISPQEVKPAIRNVRKTIYWKSSGEN